MERRIVVAYAIVLTMLGGLVCRLSFLSSQDSIAEAVANQATSILEVAETRGTIYDRNFKPIVNQKGGYIASVLPSEQSENALIGSTDIWEEKRAIHTKMTEMQPFVMKVGTNQIYSKGVEVFYLPDRYQDDQIATHLIGQYDVSTQKGLSGLEYAYDDLLTATGGSLKIRYTTDGLKRGIDGEPPEIMDTGYLSAAGLVLTLDSEIQEIAEKASRTIEKGAVVVMDSDTGDILASVSRPTFNPNDMASALTDTNSPFINRAFYSYSVGSTFKSLVAMTALEHGESINRAYTCKGWVDIGGNIIKCQNRAGHGTIEMTKALEQSCNPYFITLALEIGGQTLLQKAVSLGFGTASELAPGMKTQSGTLPTATELLSPAVTANFAFGQGVLSATPIQIATMISAVANGGQAVTPRLVEGATADGKTYSTHTAEYTPKEVFLSSAAQETRKMLIEVVEEGSGAPAKPEIGGAGGKTSSAQTGQFDENDEEIIHAWFAGFYPANDPKYTIVVLVEGGDSGSDTACPVFKEIADGITELEKAQQIIE